MTFNKTTLLVVSVFILIVSILVPTSINAQTTDLDDIPNIGAAINTTAINVSTAAEAAQGAKEEVKETVLDKIAIIAAKIAVRKMTAATHKWVAGGFKNGEKLFVESFKSTLQEAGSTAIRSGLNELLTPLKEGVYQPGLNQETKIDLTQTPAWINTYIGDTYKIDDFNKLEKFVTGIGIKEITGFCNGGIASCATSEKFIAMDAGSCSAGNTWPQNFTCKIKKTRWQISVGLRSGDVLQFAVTGYNPFSQPITYTGAGGGTQTYLTPVTTDTTPVSKDGKSPSEPKPFGTESYDRGELNPFAQNLTRTVVGSYQSTLAGTLKNTMEQELGPNWVQYANDATVSYNKLDPYASFDLLLSPGNNPVGTLYEASNRIVLEADKTLMSFLAQSTSSGFKPDQTCEQIGSIVFPDGTSEETCAKYKISTPASLVSGQVTESITQGFDIKNMTQWEQLGLELLTKTTDAVIAGGIEAASGEIRNKSSEVSTQISQLGPLSYLFGKVGQELNLSDDQSWLKLSSRQIDFTDLNKSINLTVAEATAANETRKALFDIASPTMALDQECALGPDFGWEQRIRANFSEDTEKLAGRVQKDSTESNGLNGRERARSNFKKFLEDELERQISWVKEAMPSNPFPLQSQVLGFVNGVPRELQSIQIYNDKAAAKRDAATTLANVRALVKDVPGGEILLQKPPVWQDDIDQALEGLSDLSSLGIGDNEQTKQEIRVSRNDDDEPSITGGTSFPSITVNKPLLILPAQQSEDGTPVPFDVTQGVIVLDKEDGDITRQMVVTIEDISNSNNPVLISGKEIDLTSSFEITPATATEPAVTIGATYRVTYEVLDTDLNPGVPRYRTIKLRTYNNYLEDLSAFNLAYTNFLTGLASQPLSTKSRLSQAVNLYLGVEKDISTESSLRETRGTRERAEQKSLTAYELLDECWLSFYELDKLIQQDSIPAIKTTTLTPTVPNPTLDNVNGIPVLPSIYGDEWNDFTDILDIRTDARIPYITRALPFQLRRSSASASGPIDAIASTLIEPYKDLLNAVFSNNSLGTGNLQNLVKRNLVPELVYVDVPDFQCTLDAEKILNLNEICNNNSTCVSSIFKTYEKYHCISEKEVFTSNQTYDLRRKNTNTQYSTSAYGPGRLPLGVYEEIATLPDTDGDSSNGIQRDIGDCINNGRFKSDVLGSPIDGCQYWYGTLVHRIPRIEKNAVETGLSWGNSNVLPFVEVWNKKEGRNYSWPAQFTGYHPDPTDPNRQWVEGTMHTVDVYGDHTRGILYCDFNGVIVNTIHDFNEIWGVAKDGEKDNWWNGGFQADGITPDTTSLGSGGGYKYWSDVQRCDDWTKSDLSTYTNFPKSEL